MINSSGITNRKRENRGFTLIELVIVIVILGVLTAVAAPRFIGMSDEAHDARTRGLFGAYIAGVKLYHMGYQSAGNSGHIAQLTSFGDGTVGSSLQGFPMGAPVSLDGGNPKLNGNDCKELWEKLIEDTSLELVAHGDNKFDGDTSKPIMYWYGTGANSTFYCYYTYIGRENAKGVSMSSLRYNPYTGESSIQSVRY